jgi:RNA polymerase sigma factor (sigma-70 family)
MTTAVKNTRLSAKGLLELKRTEKRLISKLVTGYFDNGRKISQEKTQIIIDNFPLAVHMAKKFYRAEYDIQDLVQVAAIGLIKAVKKYNVNMKTRLSHYAIPTIEGEIKHYLRDNFYSIKVSRKCLELNAKLQKFREEHLYNHGREATVTEIAKKFKMKEREVTRVMDSVKIHNTVSLDEPIGSIRRVYGSSATRLEEVVSGSNNIDRMLEIEGLNEAIGSLTLRDQQIIKDAFIRELGQTDIASRYNITQAQVSRILKSACQKMYTVMM